MNEDNHIAKRQWKSAIGSWLTASLFIEKCRYDKELARYTLSEEDHPDGYKSLYLLYIKELDVHEITFAEKYLGGYQHWKHLCEANWFKPYIQSWREELELKLMSLGFSKIKEAMLSGDPKLIAQASKYMSDRGWDNGVVKTSPFRGPGRPKTKHLKNQALDSLSEGDVKQDFQRLLGDLNNVN